MQSASIVILTFNKLEYTKLCIESIRQFTDKDSYEIIVVDNHSTDGTIDWLKEQADIHAIYNNENLGFPKGCNQGISIAKGDILLLNNDVIVTYQWLNNLRQCLYSGDDVGAVGAITNSCSNNQTIPVSYQSLSEMLTFATQYNIAQPADYEERLKLIGFCLLIRKSVVAKIGLLDEIFTPGNFEDDDYSVRIRQAGFRLLLCRNTFVHHFGSVSFKENPQGHIQLLEENEKKFIAKWGYNPKYLTYNQDLINLIDCAPTTQFRILDVGCACGANLLKINKQYKNVELYGIERNARAAKEATMLASVLTADLDSVKLDYPPDFFDFIILADILEDLFNPWEVLKRLYTHLAPNGKILASIRNIMHFGILRSLLYGYWFSENSEPAKLPLRFFTLHEINNMFITAGFNDLKYSMAQINSSDEDKQFINTLTALTDEQMKGQYFAYQYFVKARKTTVRPFYA